VAHIKPGERCATTMVTREDTLPKTRVILPVQNWCTEQAINLSLANTI
jgi:hypothetical protein